MPRETQTKQQEPKNSPETPEATQQSANQPADTPASPPSPETPSTVQGEKPSEQDDLWLNQILSDLGVATEGAARAPLPETDLSAPRVTLSEASRYREEEAARKAADENADASAETETSEGDSGERGKEKPAQSGEPKDDSGKGQKDDKVVVKKKDDADRKISDLVREAVQEAMQQRRPPESAEQPQDTKPAKAPEQSQPSDPYEEALLDEQKDELEFARFAAQHEPDRFGKLPDQYLSFWKKLDSYVERARKEDPERTFDESDEEFQKFIRENQPKVSPRDRRRLEADQIKEQARREVEKSYESKWAEIERKQRELEIKPKIEETTKQFAGLVEEMMMKPGEESISAGILSRAKDAGWDATIKDDPVLAPVVQQGHQNALNLASEYLAVANGVKDFDPNNKLHAGIARFINDQGDLFAKNGGDGRYITGDDGVTREFLPKSRYLELREQDPNSVANYWTFTDDQILKMLALGASRTIEDRVKDQLQRLESAGFTRTKPSGKQREPSEKIPKPENSTQNPTPKQPPAKTPKAHSSPSPGAAQPSAPQQPSPMMRPEELAALLPGQT